MSINQETGHRDTPSRAEIQKLALKLAGATLLAGERLDMGALAGQLGINRTTLYRWFGSRDQLIADALWKLADSEIAFQDKQLGIVDGPRSQQLIANYVQVVIESPGIRAFLERDSAYAFQLLTGRQHGYHAQFVARIHELLRRDDEAGMLAMSDEVPLDDLAYATTRIIEMYAHSRALTGDPPDPERANRVLRALLR